MAGQLPITGISAPESRPEIGRTAELKWLKRNTEGLRR
jgi:hypothetical protein